MVDEVVGPEARTLLELGSGGGNNASHLKARFECTLTDLSPDVLALRRSIPLYLTTGDSVYPAIPQRVLHQQVSL